MKRYVVTADFLSLFAELFGSCEAGLVGVPTE